MADGRPGCPVRRLPSYCRPPIPATGFRAGVSAGGGDTFEPIIPPERAIKEWIPDDEPPDLWDQTAGFSNDWSQSRPDPKLNEVDLGDGRILAWSVLQIAL